MFCCNLHRRVHIVVALVVVLGLSRIAWSEELEQAAEAVQVEAAVQVELIRATVAAKAAADTANKDAAKKDAAKKDAAKKDGEEKKAKDAKKKKGGGGAAIKALFKAFVPAVPAIQVPQPAQQVKQVSIKKLGGVTEENVKNCLLYTSPSPRDLSTSRMPSSA